MSPQRKSGADKDMLQNLREGKRFMAHLLPPEGLTASEWAILQSLYKGPRFQVLEGFDSNIIQNLVDKGYIKQDENQRSYRIRSKARDEFHRAFMLSSAGEERLYYPVSEALTDLLRRNLPVSRVHLEITADKKFSNNLKVQIPTGRELIFHFLKDAPPDITGYIARGSTGYNAQFEETVEFGESEFVVVEIKADQLRLDNVYQAKKYADLFDSKYALLVSTDEIPEELKRLSRLVNSLLKEPKILTLARFDEDKSEFVEWFPKNPFEDSSFLKSEKPS